MTKIAMMLLVGTLAAGVPVIAQQSTAAAQQEDEFIKGAYPADTPKLVKPVVIRNTFPKYTREAMQAKVQGVVEVQVVVMPDGSVGRARVTRSLDATFGLDEEALIAAKQWRFRAGTLDGTAVPVLATLELEFRLH